MCIRDRITEQLVKGEQQAMGAQQDPLVKIKQQEIDLKAMDLQRKAQETKFKQDQENLRLNTRIDFEYDRLAQQAQQSDERLEVAREKMRQK